MTHLTAETATTAPAAAPPSERTSAVHDSEHDTEHRRGALEQAATVLMLPVTVARQLVPDNPVPVALGASALAVAGVIEWPVAAAIGLGYLAVRGWAPKGAGRPAPSPDRRIVGSAPTGV